MYYNECSGNTNEGFICKDKESNIHSPIILLGILCYLYLVGPPFAN